MFSNGWEETSSTDNVLRSTAQSGSSAELSDATRVRGAVATEHAPWYSVFPTCVSFSLKL